MRKQLAGLTTAAFVMAAVFSFNAFPVINPFDDVNQVPMEQPDNIDSASTLGVQENTDFVDTVYVYKNGELVSKTKNVLMEGEQAVQNQTLDNNNAYDWDQITLGNGTAPIDSSTSLDSEISTGGLPPSAPSTARLLVSCPPSAGPSDIRT